MFITAECADTSELLVQRLCRKFNSEKLGDHGGQVKNISCFIMPLYENVHCCPLCSQEPVDLD